MKRFLIAALVALTLCGGAFAQSKKDKAPAAAPAGTEPYMDPGTIAISAGVGYGIFWGMDFSAGVDFMLGDFDISGIPFTWGLSARGTYYSFNYGSWGGTTNYWSYAGGGVFGNLHFDMNWMKTLPENMGWLKGFDWYVGLGAGFYLYHDDYYSTTPTDSFVVGIRSMGGFNYFFTPNFALQFEGGYYGGWGGGLIGLLFKL